MVMITLYAKQKKRHRCTEQTFELCGRRWGWDVLRERDQNMYIISSKQTTSPGGMHETSAQGWCTGKTQRDGVGRDVGKGSGWGIYVNPWLIHVNVWQKTIQYCKVISLQPVKINGGKKRILAWVAMPSARGSSQLRDWTQISCIAGGFFTVWATKEAQEYWSG